MRNSSIIWSLLIVLTVSAGVMGNINQDYYESLLHRESNIVENPLFADGFTGWGTFGPSGPFAWSFVDDERFGQAIRVEGAMSYDLVYQDVHAVVPGVEYVALVWIKTSIHAEDSFARLTVAGHNRSQDVVQYIASSDQRLEPDDPVSQRGDTDWQLHRVVFTTADDTAYVTLQGTSMGIWDFEDTAMWTGFVLMRTDEMTDEDWARTETHFSNLRL